MLSEERHRFAQLDAIDLGFDGLEFSANVGRRVGLGVPDVDMARASLEETENHPLGFAKPFGPLEAAGRGLRFQSEILGQAQPGQPGRTHANELAPRPSVTKLSQPSRYR